MNDENNHVVITENTGHQWGLFMLWELRWNMLAYTFVCEKFTSFTVHASLGLEAFFLFFFFSFQYIRNHIYIYWLNDKYKEGWTILPRYINADKNVEMQTASQNLLLSA